MNELLLNKLIKWNQEPNEPVQFIQQLQLKLLTKMMCKMEFGPI